MRPWLDGLLKSERKKALPILSFPSVNLMGITVRELISDSSLQAKGMKMIADRVDSAASVSMMDLSLEAETFGAEIKISDNEVPTVTGSIVKNLQDAQGLAIPKVGAGRTGRYIEAIGKACGLITDRPVFSGVIGPFSLAGRLMDVSEIMVSCLVEPETVHITMEKTAAFLIEYIKAYKEAGANGVIMAEPLTGMLSPGLAAEFSTPYVKRIAESVKGDNFAFFYHNCGNNTPLMAESLLTIGADGYHFGNSVKMKDMLEKFPPDVILMGNIDPAGLFRNGTPESIKAATKGLMGECCPGHRNFVISSGCDIPPASGFENIDAFFEAVKEFYD
ncbi:MAG: uroporphyrinogen decarboxylase family protein [Oscillospiraceae bacterium]|nr:uroporphyrinogen decarboxylase family protein [Oscillospiraceae bacterium]